MFNAQWIQGNIVERFFPYFLVSSILKSKTNVFSHKSGMEKRQGLSKSSSRRIQKDLAKLASPFLNNRVVRGGWQRRNSRSVSRSSRGIWKSFCRWKRTDGILPRAQRQASRSRNVSRARSHPTSSYAAWIRPSFLSVARKRFKKEKKDRGFAYQFIFSLSGFRFLLLQHCFPYFVIILLLYSTNNLLCLVNLMFKIFPIFLSKQIEGGQLRFPSIWIT